MELEKLKAYADRMREPAIQKLLSKDDVYQTECEAERKAEQKYISLDLTDHERRICDYLLRSLDARWMEYASDSYLAGWSDALTMFRNL